MKHPRFLSVLRRVDFRVSALIRKFERAHEGHASARRTLAGFGLLLLGCVLVFLPGPGSMFLFAGLCALATRYMWARKMFLAVLIFFRKLLRRSLPVVPGHAPAWSGH